MGAFLETGLKASLPPAQEEIAWIHVLRIFGAFSVVVIHVAYPVTSDFKIPLQMHWFWGHGWESFFRSGVAIFLMLSGALLMGETEPKGQFLKKRLVKILPPFLLWSLVYLFLTDASKGLTIGEWVVLLVTGAAPHLWYVKTMVLMYLLLAFTGKAFARLKNSQRLVLFCLGEAILLASLVYRESPLLNETRNFLACFLFVLLGFYLSQVKLTVTTKKWGGLFLFLAGAMMTFLGTYFYSVYSGTYKDFFYSLLAPNILMKTVGAFLFFSSFPQKKMGRVWEMAKKLSAFTFGIYLIHPLVAQYVLVPLGIHPHWGSPLVGIPVTASLCFLISFLFLYLVSKVRFSRYLM
ncbi:MAG: acyltransferase [Rufibacter sp.]